MPDIGVAEALPRHLPAALVTISQSNCVGCHDFTGASAGPSFAAIAARHKGQSAAATELADAIRNGSKGRWGSAAMPAHSDMSEAEAREVGAWIIGHGTDTMTRYAIGAQGSITVTAPVPKGVRAGIVLTAYYAGPLSDETPRSAGPRSRVVLIGGDR